ncbi:response regulator [Echinicola pacifica]|nr:response regulator [Echinicola pacifica]
MKSSIKIALVYILIGGGWVAFSSLYFDTLMEQLGLMSVVQFEVIKAILFVVLSGVLIYFLVDRSIRQDRMVWSKYSVVYDHIPICMWIIEKGSGQFVSSNLATKRIFGGDSLFDDPTKFLQKMGISDEESQRIFSGHLVSLKEHQIIDQNGQTRLMDIYTVPFEMEEQQRVMVTAVDNTGLRLSLLEKEKLNKSLKWQNERLKKYSFMNSHNLRRPLSNILGIVTLLKENGIDTEYVDLLQRSSEELDEEVKNMNEILAEEMVKNENTSQDSKSESKTILIVDDDKVQHLINRRLLLGTDPSLNLVFFSNPIDAWEWLMDNGIDLLLLDINMPEMKGWDFLDKMIEKGLEVEVKMLSSSIDPRDEERSKEYEMVTGFLVKPLKKDSLAGIL